MSQSLIILTLVGIIIFLVPLVCRKLHIPTIVGLLLAGMCVGPHGFGLIEESSTISVFAGVGMLYIMFMSGVEQDLSDFRRNRWRVFLLGCLTFFCPALLALVAARCVLHYSWLSSCLLAAMLGSHTLMTYPILSRYNIQLSRVVNIAVGGTMVAITISLLSLAVISSIKTGNTLDWHYWLKMVGGVLLFAVAVVWLFPRVAQWFFKRVNDPMLEFLLVFIMMVAAALLAQMAELDGILGAFMAGVALNRLIPNRSPLMNRLNFVGNTFLIPVFLLSVGMMVDIQLFWSGWAVVTLTVLICLTKLLGKGVASLIVGRLWRLKSEETELIFALTQATAAGTLAVVTIGFRLELFSSQMLSATVLMIFILCTTASFLTEHAAKLLSLDEMNNPSDNSAQEKEVHVLIPVSNPTTDDALVDLAELSIGGRSARLTALAVIDHPDKSSTARRLLEHAEAQSAAYVQPLATLETLAANICNGIIQVAEQQQATQILIGASDEAHSPVIEGLLEGLSLPIWIYHQQQPLSTINCMRVAVPKHAEKEMTFPLWFDQLRQLAKETGARVVFYTNQETRHYLKALCARPDKNLRASFVEMNDWDEMLMLDHQMQPDDMLVFVVARRSTVSYNPLFDELPRLIKKFFNTHNHLTIYPSQTVPSHDAGLFLTQIPQSSESFSVISRVKAAVLRVWRRRQRMLHNPQ